jgi:E1A-binding protein p400
MYVDQTMCFLYEPSTMSESQLPPIYVKKEHKRARIDPAIVAARKLKVRKEEHPRVPRSLFDRPLNALKKDSKLLKLRQQTMAGLKPGLQKPLPSLVQGRPMLEPQAEWLVNEDWALLQVC